LVYPGRFLAPGRRNISWHGFCACIHFGGDVRLQVCDIIEKLVGAARNVSAGKYASTLVIVEQERCASVVFTKQLSRGGVQIIVYDSVDGLAAPYSVFGVYVADCGASLGKRCKHPSACPAQRIAASVVIARGIAYGIIGNACSRIRCKSVRVGAVRVAVCLCFLHTSECAGGIGVGLLCENISRAVVAVGIALSRIRVILAHKLSECIVGIAVFAYTAHLYLGDVSVCIVAIAICGAALRACAVADGGVSLRYIARDISVVCPVGIIIRYLKASVNRCPLREHSESVIGIVYTAMRKVVCAELPLCVIEIASIIGIAATATVGYDVYILALNSSDAVVAYRRMIRRGVSVYMILGNSARGIIYYIVVYSRAVVTYIRKLALFVVVISSSIACVIGDPYNSSELIVCISRIRSV